MTDENQSRSKCGRLRHRFQMSVLWRVRLQRSPRVFKQKWAVSKLLRFKASKTPEKCGGRVSLHFHFEKGIPVAGYVFQNENVVMWMQPRSHRSHHPRHQRRAPVKTPRCGLRWLGRTQINYCYFETGHAANHFAAAPHDWRDHHFQSDTGQSWCSNSFPSLNITKLKQFIWT